MLTNACVCPFWPCWDIIPVHSYAYHIDNGDDLDRTILLRAVNLHNGGCALECHLELR